MTANSHTVQKQPVPCPVCGTDDPATLYEPWVTVDDPALLYGTANGVQGTQRIVRCRACGMIYENPRYPEETILAGYMSAADDGHDSQYPQRVRSFLRALQKSARDLPPPGAKVLDIGCAGGAFLDAARDFGYQVSGLEPSRILAERARRRGFDVAHGTIDKHDLAHGAYDLICLWDVIEHLCEPRQALAKIRELLKPDGRLLINFPDIGTWQARLAGRRFWWILSVHLHHFDRRSLARLLRFTGFEPLRCRRYWQTLEFGYLQDMAVHLGVPLARGFAGLTPAALRRLPLAYYASQTTMIARPAP